MVKTLNDKGYAAINKLNTKYKISIFEITDRAQVSDFMQVMDFIINNTYMVSEEDVDTYEKLLKALEY